MFSQGLAVPGMRSDAKAARLPMLRYLDYSFTRCRCIQTLALA